MGDRKFSGYTIVHPDYEGWPAPPIYRLVGPAIEQSGETTCDIYYRPNRKGGHTHNCCRNCLKKCRRKVTTASLKEGAITWDSLRGMAMAGETSEEEWDSETTGHFMKMTGMEEPWQKPAP